jgi:hypothetical protein
VKQVKERPRWELEVRSGGEWYAFSGWKPNPYWSLGQNVRYMRSRAVAATLQPDEDALRLVEVKRVRVLAEKVVRKAKAK